MKLRTLPLLCSLAVTALCPAARATLIGDTITVSHLFPNITTAFETQVTTVQAGTGDAVFFFGINSVKDYSVNPESASLAVRFLRNTFFFPTTFNGLGVSGIDDTIIGASVSTNLVGWDLSRFAFGPHSITANWQGLDFNTNSFFDVFFQLQPAVVATPDAGAAAVLFSLALIGLAGLRQKFAL
jgi:hypothetical protein